MAATNAHEIRLPHLTPRHDPYRLALGYRVGDLVYTSGQLGLDETGAIAEDYDGQVGNAFANLERILTAAGSGLDKVIRTTVYQTDIANLHRFVELRGMYLKAPYPASTQVAITKLGHPDALIEINAIALVEGKMIAP
jgi:2-iminobutanoate/2-iminopropanoate deaminase